MEERDYLGLFLERAQDLVELDAEIGAMVQEAMRGVSHPAYVVRILRNELPWPGGLE